MYQSEKLNELAPDFVKFQGEVENIKKTKDGHFKYAGLDDIIEAVSPYLSKNGLCLYQYTSIEDGETLLHSRLLHTSGQWVEGISYVMPDDNPKLNALKNYGSGLTYQRRYSALAILGLSTNKEDDPDNHNNEDNSKDKPTNCISPKHLQEIKAILRENSELTNTVLNGYGVKRLSELPYLNEYSFNGLKNKLLS